MPGELVGMNRRKSLVVISPEPTLYSFSHIPPFSKIYNAIVVGIDVVKEIVKARVGYGQTGTDKRSA